MFKTHQSYKRPFIYADRQGGSASHDDRHANPKKCFIAGLSCRQSSEGERERERWMDGKGKKIFFFLTVSRCLISRCTMEVG